jgi:ArsR family transcriptional regulator
MIVREVMAVTNALSDANRVRILQALKGGELCVCQITEFLGLSPSTASKHLSILRSARLVDARKEGRWMYYRLPGDDAPPSVRGAIEWLQTALARDPKVKEDRRRLEAVLKEDPEEICRRQMGRSRTVGRDTRRPTGSRHNPSGSTIPGP